MEGFEALQALNRSRRKVWIGLVGSPATAWLWRYTIEVSRAFEAGRVTPRAGADPFEFVWFYLSMGLEGVVGRTGLHAFLGCLVLAALGVGLWGSIQRRNLDRRGVTARAQRQERGTFLRWPLTATVEGAEIEDRGRLRTSWALSTLGQFLLLGRALLPVASMGATAYFAWKALLR